MSVIFVVVVVICAISLISLFNQAVQSQTNPSNGYIGGTVEYYGFGCLSQTITFSLMVLGMVVFIIAVFVPKTYDDYLLGWTIWQPILMVWVSSILWPGIKLFTSSDSDSPRLARFLRVVIWVALGLFLWFVLPQVAKNYEQTAQALWTEPLIITGDVQDKSFFVGTRGGTTYYAVIDEVEYRIPDRGWYNSLRIGQTITFIAGPPNFLLETRDIFLPNEVGHTWVSVVLATVGAGAWLITAVVVSQGMRGIIGRFWPKPSNPLPEPIKAKPVESHKVIELAKPVNYWLLGGGLLMLLFSYLYSLKRIKKK